MTTPLVLLAMSCVVTDEPETDDVPMNLGGSDVSMDTDDTDEFGNYPTSEVPAVTVDEYIPPAEEPVCPVVTSELEVEGEIQSIFPCTEPATQEPAVCYVTKQEGTYDPVSQSTIDPTLEIHRVTGNLEKGLEDEVLAQIPVSPTQADINGVDNVSYQSEDFYAVRYNSYPASTGGEGSIADYTVGNQQDGTQHGVLLYNNDGILLRQFDLFNSSPLGVDFALTGPTGTHLSEDGTLSVLVNNYASGVGRFAGDHGVVYSTSGLVQAQGFIDPSVAIGVADVAYVGPTEFKAFDDYANTSSLVYDAAEDDFLITATQGVTGLQGAAAIFRYDIQSGRSSDYTLLPNGIGFQTSRVGYPYLNGSAFRNDVADAQPTASYVRVNPTDNSVQIRTLAVENNTYIPNISPFDENNRAVLVTRQFEAGGRVLGALDCCDGTSCETITEISAKQMVPHLVLDHSTYGDKRVVAVAAPGSAGVGRNSTIIFVQ